MNARNKKEGGALTLVEAVETLSNIADLEFDQDIGIRQSHEYTIQNKPLTFHTVHWLHHNDADITVSMVKETFRVILDYLRRFYQKDFASIYDPQAIEGIKAIMVLVGEAAKKLDKYTALFHKAHPKSVTELKEYKKLQEFYFNRIDRKIDEGVLGKWILALSQKDRSEKKLHQKVKLEGKASSQTKHIFIDLESVKKDSEYELFFLRKDDGARFFSPRLIRNIKLVSNFGDYFAEDGQDDPLLDMAIWLDRLMHASAINIAKACRKSIERFYAEGLLSKDLKLAEDIKKTIMALMLAVNSHNLSHHLPLKNCSDYFHDFLLFLRQCLQSADYQRLIAYPPSKADKPSNCLIDTIHHLCLALYTQLSAQELLSMVHGLIQRAEKEEAATAASAVDVKQRALWKRLSDDYAAMTRLIKLHPNGPLNKILSALENGTYHAFDPLIQLNIPTELFSTYVQERKCLFLRLPSPTHQEYIQKVFINEEFKAFLRACSHDHDVGKCLIFNFQDRGSWREQFRCEALEDVPHHESLAKHIDVISIAKDTDFYHQLTPFHQENHAEVFLDNFKAQLMDENSGFYFPDSINKEIQRFAKEALNTIHRIFFTGKNVLHRDERMDFIEIFYFFLELKIVDLIKPEVVFFTCKDALDIASSAGTQLFILLKFLNQERLSEHDREYVDLMLYGPCLLFRERLMLQERFNRTISTLKCVEAIQYQFGLQAFSKLINEAFGHLYSTPILKGKAIAH